jgi:hypothetical protein
VLSLAIGTIMRLITATLVLIFSITLCATAKSWTIAQPTYDTPFSMRDGDMFRLKTFPRDSEAIEGSKPRSTVKRGWDFEVGRMWERYSLPLVKSFWGRTGPGCWSVPKLRPVHITFQEQPIVGVSLRKCYASVKTS